MANDDLRFLPAADLASAIARRKVSPVEAVQAVLDAIDKTKTLNAWVTVDGDAALKAARAAERAAMRRGARLGPLHGVPFGVKDLITTKGVRTTFGTPLYRDNVPVEDAPTVDRMKAAGAIMIGKTNTPTLGWVGITDNLVFGLTRNPWNPERTPGGSSGGAGAALAAGMAPLHLGTDGGGSIRKPSAFTGTFGLKASYGRVPVYPASAAWSLSHVGPMTRTVKDAALMMNVIAGPDERDPCSLPAARLDYVKALKGPLKGLRVAYSDTLGLAPAVDPEVRNATARAARAFSEIGCRVEHVNPGWASPWEPWRTIFLGGIAARLQPYLHRKQEIDAGLLAIVEESLTWPPTKFVQAWLDRLAWCTNAMELFERYELLLTPTTAMPAFRHGMLYPTEIAGVKVDREASSVFTYPFNLTGQPAASVPCGFTKDGLPIGLQIVGRRFDDATVLRASAAFEAARPWIARRPPPM